MRCSIVYEDKDIIVIDKPAGLAVQSANNSQQDAESELRNYLNDKYGSYELYVIHRLDQPVSGLLVFAKNKKSAAALSKAVSGNGMKKVYHAEVYGVMDNEAGELTDYLLADKKAGIAKVVKKPADSDTRIKKAVLQYKVLEKGDNKSLLEVTLDTGRFHQIRVQLANTGHPILGDRKYATKESAVFSDENGIHNICLRAVSLSFEHPFSKKTVTFTKEHSDLC